MNYLELSAENAKKETIKLAEIIGKDFTPDSVIFISKGAYQIGLDLGNYFNVPVLEIFAERKANKLKSMLSPILKIIPSKIKFFLRKYEVKIGIHKNNTDRDVHWGYVPPEYQNINFEKILLVDDSCDTGNSFIQCIQEIHNKYLNAEIKTAAINVFSSSFDVINTDYYLHKDCTISGPWSKDSKENKEFVKHYLEIFD